MLKTARRKLFFSQHDGSGKKRRDFAWIQWCQNWFSRVHLMRWPGKYIFCSSSVVSRWRTVGALFTKTAQESCSLWARNVEVFQMILPAGTLTIKCWWWVYPYKSGSNRPLSFGTFPKFLCNFWWKFWLRFRELVKMDRLHRNSWKTAKDSLNWLKAAQVQSIRFTRRNLITHIPSTSAWKLRVSGTQPIRPEPSNTLWLNGRRELA